MAVTRRQFVAGMSALAASAGFNSAQIAKITEALAIGGLGLGVKPKVLWVHGAECTGCSVSLLSLYEDARGQAIRGTSIRTLDALNLALDDGESLPRTFATANPEVGTGDPIPGALNVDGSAFAVNVQDILVDWVDLQYHETVMSMGGDMGYRVLAENMVYNTGNDPFVLVVEGAVQDKGLGGAWSDTGTHPWCSVGMPDSPGTAVLDGATPLLDLSFDDVVQKLAERADCAAVIAIGQCATYGGVPASVSPAFKDFLGVGDGDNNGRQTGAMGTYEFLVHKSSAAAAKVVNVPGCPTNPWWFVLTVVAFLVDLKGTLGAPAGTVGPLGILTAATPALPAITGGVDATRRLTAVYGTPLHGPACARYREYVKGNFADNPGEDGCLQLIGCKGPSVNSTCGVHGWNGQQPENRESLRGTGFIDSYNVADFGNLQGGNCIMAGHPCMGCTEQGYPDAFVPFVLR